MIGQSDRIPQPYELLPGATSMPFSNKTHTVMLGVILSIVIILIVALTSRPQIVVQADESSDTVSLPAIFKPLAPASSVSLQEFITPLTYETITVITHAGDDRIFVATQSGRVFIVDPGADGMSGTVRPRPFLDLRAEVEVSFEEGLIGLAFDPDFATNGTFYVTYNENRGSDVSTGGDLNVSRFKIRDDLPDEADKNSEEKLFVIQKSPAPGVGSSRVHSAGDLHFGPDGYLYISLGDGGPDPFEAPQGSDTSDIWDHGQRLDEPWGSILRIDVSANPVGGTAPDCGIVGYVVPAGNPFVDGSGSNCDEIWSYGFRNPWRFSFDRVTGDMYIGDVGGGLFEEVNYEPRDTPGRNYGWACYEGTKLNSQLCVGNYTFAAHQYNHDDGSCSVIGGIVYRGADYPTLFGQYVFTDFCSHTIWSLNSSNLAAGSRTLLSGAGLPAWTTIGEDVNGELYMGSYGTGRVLKVTVP
jgi:glucose/arabinose dehydrogenase